MVFSKRIALAASLGAAAFAVAIAQIGSAVAATNCVPRKNVELILDDSGSMSITDSGKLRVDAAKLLLKKQANRQKTFGAVQFGSDASTVFAPGVVATGQAAMEAALDAQIQADDGATNYNAAFDKARADNPNADARIFLTDGGHNEGAYAEGHRGGPRTDVIGFGSSTLGDSGERLRRIAAETGGVYFPETDAANLPRVMNDIDAAQNCQAAPKRFTDQVTRPGQTFNHATRVNSRTRSIDMVLSWVGPANQFDITRARIVRRGRTVAQSKRRRRTKLRISRTKGSTFLSIKISRVKRGTLRFRLRTKTLVAPTTLVTQVGQSRSR